MAHSNPTTITCDDRATEPARRVADALAAIAADVRIRIRRAFRREQREHELLWLDGQGDA